MSGLLNGEAPIPAVAIEDMLNRRSDLSTFLIHLTKATIDGKTAKENLRSILVSHNIEARNAMGWKSGLSAEARATMKVVCFSETPLEHAYSLFANIERRREKLSSYGVAFTKQEARSRGANPIWYVDMTPGHSWALSRALDLLRDQANSDPGGFQDNPAASVLPFIEQMGTWRSTMSKEFWWEREWRHLGDFDFGFDSLSLVLCPERDIEEFSAMTRFPVIDPSWSLERIISRLAALAAAD